MKENQHLVKIRIQIVLNLDKMYAETQISRDTYGKTAANSVDIAQVRTYENPEHIYWKLTTFITIKYLFIKIIIVNEPIGNFYIVSTTSTTAKSPVTSPKPTTAPSTTTTTMKSTQTREPTTLPTGAGKINKTCAGVRGCWGQPLWEI